MSRRRSSQTTKFVLIAVVAVVVVVGLALGLIDLDDLLAPTEGSSGSNPSAEIGGGSFGGSGSPDEARDALSNLAVAESGSMSGYSREEFPHWQDAGENGWDVPSESCDARDGALIRDGEDVMVGDPCDVESGTWVDPYSGVEITDPSSIDIDHIVPLANAWRSGADEWDEATREEFANAPQNLISSDAGENRSKGDSGPEAWRPPDEGVWCDYAIRWTLIKSDYDLSVNPDEKTSIEEMLDTCEAA